VSTAARPRAILVGMIAGAAAGVLAHALLPAGDPSLAWLLTNVAEPAGRIFLRLLFVLVIPIVLSALPLGIVGVGEASSLGRIAGKTFVYTLLVSIVCVLLGVGLVNALRPGHAVSPALRASLQAQAAERASSLPTANELPRGGIDLLVNIVPDNVVKAMANGDLLAVMFFALLLGIGLARTRTTASVRFREVLEGVYDVSIQLIDLVLRLAPFGVFALLFSMTARFGWALLPPLAGYVGVVLLGLGIHQFVVYPILVRYLGGMSPLRFFRDIRAAMLTAFSTASSNATLPTALRVADENLRLPRSVSRFVLTLGSTANQNGTALFEGVTVLFLAQFYGVDLTLAQQTLVVMICILGSIGTAGVPAGSLPVILMILGMIGVPAEGMGMILGVDRFLDMCRTTLNVTGDLAAAVVVSRGEHDPPPAATGMA
jgi:Na+/H+-dicarboxylate symporter